MQPIPCLHVKRRHWGKHLIWYFLPSCYTNNQFCCMSSNPTTSIETAVHVTIQAIFKLQYQHPNSPYCCPHKLSLIVQYCSKVSYQSFLVSHEMRVASLSMRISYRETGVVPLDTRLVSWESLKWQFWNKLQANFLKETNIFLQHLLVNGSLLGWADSFCNNSLFITSEHFVLWYAYLLWYRDLLGHNKSILTLHVDTTKTICNWNFLCIHRKHVDWPMDFPHIIYYYYLTQFTIRQCYVPSSYSHNYKLNPLSKWRFLPKPKKS